VWGDRNGLTDSRFFRHADCGTTLDEHGYCAACKITPAVQDIVTEPREGRGGFRDDPVAVALRGPHRLLEPLEVG
jgi:hypothetical protein